MTDLESTCVEYATRRLASYRVCLPCPRGAYNSLRYLLFTMQWNRWMRLPLQATVWS